MDIQLFEHRGIDRVEELAEFDETIAVMKLGSRASPC
jgi:hypothetical protein